MLVNTVNGGTASVAHCTAIRLRVLPQGGLALEFARQLEVSAAEVLRIAATLPHLLRLDEATHKQLVALVRAEHERAG